MTKTTTKPQAAELLPCPFCGKGNVKTFGSYGWYHQWGISHSCSAFYSGTQEMFQGFRSEADAVAAWNTRALASQPTPSAVGELIADIGRELSGAPGSPDNRRKMLMRARDALTTTTSSPINGEAIDRYPHFVGSIEAKVESYNQIHEDCLEMGYPSATEALEHLEDLRGDASLIGVLAEAVHDRLFGISSLGDAALALKEIGDGGGIHEAVHQLLRALPATPADALSDGGGE